jgi:hypothetical protein
VSKPLDTVHAYDNTLNIWADKVVESRSRSVLAKCVSLLKRRGFTCRLDQEVAEHHPIISRDYWEGKKDDLEFRVHTGGRCVQFEFFLTGTRYPAGNKLARMQKAMEMETIVHMKRLIVLVETLGYSFIEHSRSEVRAEPTLLSVANAMRDTRPRTPLERFNHHWTASRFERNETGWPTAKELSGYRKLPYAPGCLVYTRCKGRLVRGRAYPNMNEIWYVDTGAGDVWFEWMALDADVPRRPERIIPGQFKRLQEELAKEIATKSWRRVETLGRVLGALEQKAAVAA